MAFGGEDGKRKRNQSARPDFLMLKIVSQVGVFNAGEDASSCDDDTLYHGQPALTTFSKVRSLVPTCRPQSPQNACPASSRRRLIFIRA